MNARISSNHGRIDIGKLMITWWNQDEEFHGFTTISYGDHSIEFGDIDNGNGIFYVRYEDGDLVVNRPLIRF